MDVDTGEVVIVKDPFNGGRKSKSGIDINRDERR